MNKIREALRQEYKRIKGNRAKVHPHDVVQFAREHPTSEWYKQLEWDDGVAGEKWRVQQVRMLLAIHRVVERGSNVREIVSLSIDRKSGGGYRLLRDVMDNQDLQQVFINDALDELSRVRTKYQHIKRLSDVWEVIYRAERRERARAAGRGRRRAA